MNKELSKDEIIKKSYANRNIIEYPGGWIENAMQEYADQEKKKKAIAFGEFLKKNYITGITIGTRDAVWLSIHVNDQNEYIEEQLYEIFNQQKMKELLQQKALEYARNHSSAPDKETPDWIITDYLAGAKEILDNPELYGLVKKEFFDEAVRKNESLRSSLSASERFRMQDAAEHLDDNLLLRKENKELKEKVTALEGVIAKLSQKVINESNY